MSEDASVLLSARNRAMSKTHIIEQLENMPIVEIACKRVNVSRATYYRWLKADPEFAARCADALERSTHAVSDIAEAKLISAIQEGNMTAISFWLRSRHSAYSNKVTVNGAIRHEVMRLSPEQEALISKALRTSGLLEGETDD